MQENHPLPPPLNVEPVRGARAVAVAIQAHGENPDAPPSIVASGRGKMAQDILDIAYSHGVKVREDGALAEILAQLELDTPIPSEAIVAVAEILAKVYEANEAAGVAATPADPQPFTDMEGIL